ncbi:hypothetical protein E8E13_009304 [Curvularia kusanoi]|uniref:Uncharacterized protein n=1 Tax=Curvularia kusanoi TaxID=90978 RepID=A0A9P4TCG6_CURKU|nr:hypothetical protein E8E13_009304 [Curvularia kusanoi]
MYRSFFDASLVRDKYEANRNYQFALTQSNKAIQQLIQDQAVDNKNGTADKLTAMTCCVLFGSMANLQGQREAALKHLRSGIRMLKETKFQAYNDLTGHPININSLRSIFTGLDIQARSSISWTDVATWEPVVATMRPFEPVEIDTSSPYALSEIHCRIETLLNDTLAFNRGCVTQPATNASTIQHQHTALVARFTRITTALTTLRTKTPSAFSTPTPSTSKTLLLVASTHHWLRSSITPLKHHFNIISPLASTPYNPVHHFEDMMPHIEFLLAQSPPETPIYAAAPGPVSALWLISVSAPAECVALRKKALSMIRRLPRREGLFDAKLAGRIGARAWEVEQRAAREEVGWEGGYETDTGMEGGLDGQAGFDGDLVVPQHLRLVYMDVEFARDGEGRARVKLANGVQLMRGETTVVDVEF